MNHRRHHDRHHHFKKKRDVSGMLRGRHVGVMDFIHSLYIHNKLETYISFFSFRSLAFPPSPLSLLKQIHSPNEAFMQIT